MEIFFFSPRGFIVLGFTFRTILYYELVFIYGTRHGLKFIFLRKVGLPTWLSGRESVCQCRIPKRRGFNPWVGKIPWSRKWQHTPIFLPGKFHRQRSLMGYSPWGWRVQHDWATEHTISTFSLPLSVEKANLPTLNFLCSFVKNECSCMYRYISGFPLSFHWSVYQLKLSWYQYYIVFFKIYFNWRIITLQYCGGFCHT